MFHFSFRFILQENCPNLIDLDVSGTNIRKIHIEKLQVCFCLLSSIETVTLFSHVLSGRMGTGTQFSKVHGSGKLLLFTFKIEVSVIFAYNMMIKLQCISKMDWFVSLETCSCSLIRF